MPTKSDSNINVFGATLTRRQFVKAGGMLGRGHQRGRRRGVEGRCS